jgi:hypothetical protein
MIRGGATMIRRALFLVTAALLLAIGTASPAAAVSTATQRCQAARFKAADRYALCEHRALTTFGPAYATAKFQTVLSNCRVEYTDTWAKLQTRAPLAGSVCVGARLVDNGDGTVTDNLTALQWEKKDNGDGIPNFADLHDADNWYAWSVFTETAANGTVYTSFLSSLNSACFAGQCDWRLPTMMELQTILAEPYPCQTGITICIDDVFGKPAPLDTFYWSSTSDDPDARVVDFYFGSADFRLKTNEVAVARGVRAGL